MAANPAAKTPATPEQQRDIDRFAALFIEIAQREAPHIAELLATRPDSQLLGQTEFDLRDMLLHRVGAAFVAATLEERKKGGTKVRASSVPTVSPTPD
jgi:hypothetical protein